MYPRCILPVSSDWTIHVGGSDGFPLPPGALWQVVDVVDVQRYDAVGVRGIDFEAGILRPSYRRWPSASRSLVGVHHQGERVNGVQAAFG